MIAFVPDAAIFQTPAWVAVAKTKLGPVNVVAAT